MADRTKRNEIIKALAWFGILIILVFWLVPTYIAPLIWRDDHVKKQTYFYSAGLAGKITAVDAGRGVKIRLDNHQSYLEPSGYYCLTCKGDFTFETGENIGDSLIKKPNSDIFLLKKANGDTLTFKIIKQN
ncbi:hypothetical protein ACFGVR_11995 [Mucilaginibacter sp. AW1-3]